MAAGGAALAIVALRGGLGRAALACAAAGGTALLLGLQFGVLAPGRPAAVERMAAFVTAHRTAGEPVGSLHAFSATWSSTPASSSSISSTWTERARFLGLRDRVLVVLPERDLRRPRPAPPPTPRRLARVRHLNTANLRLRSVLNPDPAIELETIVLVTNK